MSDGLALTLIILASSLATLLSAGVIFYSLIRSRFVNEGLQAEIVKLKKSLDDPSIYLDGFPHTIERRKNIVLYSALKLYEAGDWNLAIGALMDVFLSASSDYERCSVFNMIGLCQVKSGDFRDAEKTFLKMIAEAERIELGEALAPALANTGNVYFTLGELDKALEYLQEALKIDEKTGRLKGQARDLGNIGRVYFALGEQGKVFGHYQKALEHYQKALALDRKTGSIEGEARDLGNIGAYYLAIGDSKKSAEHYQKALEAAEKINDPELQFKQLSGLGITHRTLDKYEESLGYFERALKLAERMGVSVMKADTLANMGSLRLKLGEDKLALDNFQKAHEIYARLGAKDKIALCESNITRARQKLASAQQPK